MEAKFWGRAAVLPALMLGAAVVSIAGGAYAQSVSAGSGQADGEDLTEIVVTALKRSTSLQDTPLSLSAINGDTLQKMGASGMEDYFRAIPNVNLTQAQLGSSRLTIRGIQSAGEATVGLYYDETPVTGPSGTTQDPGGTTANLNLFDVERVEVLRGPQGTLYGGGSMGGTIRVISRKPDSQKFAAASEVEYTNADGASAGFVKQMVNVPVVTDRLAVRVSGYYQTTPGYVDDTRLNLKDVNDGKSRGVRTLVGFTPTDDITLTGTISYQKQTADDQLGWYQAQGRYQTNSPVQLPYDNEMTLYNLVGTWDLHFATLTASTSFYNFNILRSIDFTPSVQALSTAAAYVNQLCPLYFGQAVACTAAQKKTYTATGLSKTPTVGYQPATLDSRNDELRLSSEGEGPFTWTAGAYLEDRHDHIDSNTATADPATGLTYQPLQDLSYRYINTYTKQTAEFGEVSYSPIGDLTLTAGTRHYDYTKTTTGQALLGSAFTASVPTAYSAVKADAQGWVSKANVSYKLTPDAMAYATASQGFRPGGANNIPGLASGLVTYTPDKLWNYEAGLKTSWMGGHLTVDAALFQVDWTNMQTSTVTSNGLYSFITNVGSARIRGGELEITARPLAGLVLTGSLGYQDGHLTSDQANAAVLATGSTGLKGDRIPNTPDLTASASATYTVPLTARLNGMVRVDYSYTGDMVSTFRPSYVYFNEYGHYSLVNTRIGVEGEGWGLYAFVNNLTDADGIVSANSNLGYTRLVYSSTPRTFGLNGRISF
ncbi:outer membrane receptor protein involved in Fe transport [Nitrospirillum amazonense]|uniref:Outer membrane receptor protein involved in Fe transport n=1 Tax=Nitrospirillum amazonense TaxID=28077 RepID=A0A560K9Q8_9PROT|nr:outer membrane receptor protein involved in Fe transport [Nitrospirillum amazonense]